MSFTRATSPTNLVFFDFFKSWISGAEIIHFPCHIAFLTFIYSPIIIIIIIIIYCRLGTLIIKNWIELNYYYYYYYYYLCCAVSVIGLVAVDSAHKNKELNWIIIIIISI
jgi:hypothetical protein